MSNNIFNSNDDDIFEEFVESPDNQREPANDKADFEKVFSEIDSPFKNIIQNASLKVNFSEAFYNAAHEWVIRGYQQANSNSLIEELTILTNGQFLYRHRLACVKETMDRKKTIIKFLSMILEDEHSSKKIVSNSFSPEEIEFSFSETYFNMFFRSFHNITLHTYYREVALYRALCDVLQVEPDSKYLDHTIEPDPSIENAEFINSLYIQYFDADLLQEKIDKYAKEIFNT